MKLGNKNYLILLSLIIQSTFSFANEKITTSPLINIEKIKPSFEELVDENENSLPNQNLKEKNI